MNVQRITKPSRNFNILGYLKIIDPIDKKEKIVMHSCAETKLSALLIVDPETMRAESYETPGDSGCWGLCQLDENTLVFGTCSYHGYIYKFDLKERKICARVDTPPNITYVWTVSLGSDGMIYGGTYPECLLLQYNPNTNEVKNLGLLDSDEKNIYSRETYGEVPGKIFVNCGFDIQRVICYDIATGEKKQFGPDGGRIFFITEEFICLAVDDDKHYLLDPHTEEKLYEHAFSKNDIEELAKTVPIMARLHQASRVFYDSRIPEFFEACVRLSNDDIIGFSGQEIFKLKPNEEKPTFYQISASAPCTSILTLNMDDDDVLWGVSTFGMTAFSYDPKTGEAVNTAGVTTSRGECYGCLPYKGNVYFTAYSAGEHIKYDPKAPWNARENVNPKMVLSLAPKYIRPHTRSIVDKDGFIWTGWWRSYGSYGSCISKWDTKTDEITVFEDLVDDLAIEHMMIWDDCIVFTAFRYGNGLPQDKNYPSAIFQMDKNGKILERKDIKGELGRFAAIDHNGIIRLDDTLYSIDLRSFEMNSIDIKVDQLAVLHPYKAYILVMDSQNVLLLDPVTGQIYDRCDSGGAEIYDFCVKGDTIWATDADGWIMKVEVSKEFIYEI